MKQRKLHVGVAALLLGVQIGSPVSAALSHVEVEAVQQYVQTGQVSELMALIALYPELLNLEGSLGDALRAFSANPSAASLASIASRTSDIAVALKHTAERSGISIY